MQKLRYSRYSKALFVAIDVIAIVGVYLWLFANWGQNQLIKEENPDKQYFLIGFIGFFWILISARTKIYTIPRNLTFTLFLERFLSQMAILLLAILFLDKVSGDTFLHDDRFMLFLGLFFMLLLTKSIIFLGLKYARSHGINYRNVMFLGDNASAEILRNTLRERKDYGYKIFEFNAENVQLPNIIKFWKENGIHTMFIPAENYGIDLYTDVEILQKAEENKVHIGLLPNIAKNNLFEFDLTYFETQPVLAPSKFPLSYFSNYFIKRVFDISFSIIFLLFIGIWLFPLISIFIKAGSSGPVFFRQRRYGYHDEVFYCIKFRTMVENEDSATKTTGDYDERITKFGKFLRKTSLDETPQFFNVLMGAMSVVGPRPHMLIVDDQYKPKISRYSVRSMVKPGITGLAQVNGLRGEEQNMEVNMQKRILADSFYVKNWSLSLDFIIVFKTVFLLIKGDKKAK